MKMSEEKWLVYKDAVLCSFIDVPRIRVKDFLVREIGSCWEWRLSDWSIQIRNCFPSARLNHVKLPVNWIFFDVIRPVREFTPRCRFELTIEIALFVWNKIMNWNNQKSDMLLCSRILVFACGSGKRNLCLKTVFSLFFVNCLCAGCKSEILAPASN